MSFSRSRKKWMNGCPSLDFPWHITESGWLPKEPRRHHHSKRAKIYVRLWRKSSHQKYTNSSIFSTGSDLRNRWGSSSKRRVIFWWNQRASFILRRRSMSSETKRNPPRILIRRVKTKLKRDESQRMDDGWRKPKNEGWNMRSTAVESWPFYCVVMVSWQQKWSLTGSESVKTTQFSILSKTVYPVPPLFGKGGLLVLKCLSLPQIKQQRRTVWLSSDKLFQLLQI